MQKLGRNPKKTGSLTWMKRRIAKEGIDISHFVKQSKQLTSYAVYTTDEMFAKGSRVQRGVVRRYILRNNLIPYRCAGCGCGPEWNGKPMALELDHINGVFNDHRLENLRFLCPNCHAITDTYCGKNRSGAATKTPKPKKVKVPKPPNYCAQCGKQIPSDQKYCSQKCYGIAKRKVKYLTPIELIKMIVDVGFAEVGKLYNVDERTVYRWCEEYNLPTRRDDLQEWLTQHQYLPRRVQVQPTHIVDKRSPLIRPTYYCERCGKEIATHSQYCVECSHFLDRKVERPDAITLAKMLLDTSFLQVGKSYGVSDNAVRKWCKQYDIPTKKPELKDWLTQHQSDT